MKAAFYTLGCKVNQYETEIMQRQFEQDGFTIVPPKEPADVYVVNSCTVTSMGDKKTSKLLRRLRRQNKDAVIALTGCFPQAFPEEAAKAVEADIITGARDRAGLLGRVKQALRDRTRVISVTPHEAGEPFEPMAAERFSEHTRAFVKIQDGCDRWCSYCIIPKARGPIRSKPLTELREELLSLAENGYREVVLVGINLSSYGRETGEYRLADAVELAGSIGLIKRVRLGSLEPELLTEEDLERLAAEDKFCPQFHLSLQSGCDKTLCRMNRHYTCGEYWKLVEKIRQRFENASVTTDMMTGFPGETEEDFEASACFAEEIGFAKVHVFAYSVRQGTRAASMDGQLSQSVKEERARRLIARMDRVRDTFLKTQCGRVEEVLFETEQDGTFLGYTKNYTPVSVKSGKPLGGAILPVKITGCSKGICQGSLIHP